MSSFSQFRCAADLRVAKCAASAGNRSVRPALLEPLCPYMLRPPPLGSPFALRHDSALFALGPVPVEESKGRAATAPHPTSCALSLAKGCASTAPHTIALALSLSNGRVSTVLHQGPFARCSKPSPFALSLLKGRAATAPHLTPFALSLSKGSAGTAPAPIPGVSIQSMDRMAALAIYVLPQIRSSR